VSVRVADRSLSKMEYIHNAQSLLFILVERINKYVNKAVSKKKNKQFVKQSLRSVWNSPIYHAQLVYKYCELAYMKRDTETGLGYLDNASQNLTLLESSIETFYQTFRKVIKDQFIILVTEKIDKQKKLLKGVRNVGCKPALRPQL